MSLIICSYFVLSPNNFVKRFLPLLTMNDHIVLKEFHFISNITMTITVVNIVESLVKFD